MLRALVTVILLCVNLAFWGTLIFLGGIVKLAIPPRRRTGIILLLASFAERWVAGNNRIFDLMLPTQWEITVPPDLRHDGHYFLIANHMSWVDIVAVLRAFQGRAPFIRFFMKSQLIWFPIAGQACWALEFPFMKRHSREYLEKYPEKRGEDLETTRRLCRRYRKVPVTILNYAEGTRFSKEKHAQQASPFRYLLRPRSGGISFVLASMNEQLDGVMDVTIAYPAHDVTMLQFLTGRVPRIAVEVRPLDVPAEFFGPEVTERGEVRDRFKQWLDQLWKSKDERIAQLLERLSTSSA
jgi:1-acyl-sn-glycerol-3-phosphate acyltransferase